MGLTKIIKKVLSFILSFILVISALTPISTASASQKNVSTVSYQGINYNIVTQQKGDTFTFTVTSDSDNGQKIIKVFNDSVTIQTINAKNNKKSNIQIDNITSKAKEYQKNLDSTTYYPAVSDWQTEVHEKFKNNYSYCYGYDGNITKISVSGDGRTSIKTMNYLTSTGKGYVNYHVSQIKQCNSYMNNALLYGTSADVAAAVAYIVAIVLTGGLAAPIALPIIASLFAGNTAMVQNVLNAEDCYTNIQDNFNNAIYAY